MVALYAECELALQLSAGAVDAKTGVIRGVTVAQANVEATGKFVMLDTQNNLTRDPEKAARKLKVVTDNLTLETLLAAANAVGGTSKSREDHDDSIGARIGYADNFHLADGKVTADLHVFDSYRHRDLLLETAAKTPKEIGISIDMTPRWEIHNDRALMRIEELLAVDVVDEGAITHDGLFLARGVDNPPKVTLSTQPSPSAMADAPKEPTLQDCMTAISTLTSSVTSLAGTVAEMQKNSKASADQMAAGQNDLREKLAAANTAIAEVKQTAPAAGADAAAETERARLAAEQERNGKTYLQLVDAEKVARKADLDSGKLKGGDIHKIVMSAHPEKYREHLKSGGIYDKSRDPKNQGRAA
jgi:hypothetical protein